MHVKRSFHIISYHLEYAINEEREAFKEESHLCNGFIYRIRSVVVNRWELIDTKELHVRIDRCLFDELSIVSSRFLLNRVPFRLFFTTFLRERRMVLKFRMYATRALNISIIWQ